MADDQPTATRPEGDKPAARPRARRSPLRVFIWTAIVGTGFGLMVILLIAFLHRGDGLPEIDAAAVGRASDRWDAEGPASYDMELRVSGPRDQLVEVEVRDRRVTKLLLNGVAPSQRRTWDYWSVPGLFDIIEDDLARADSSPGSVRVFAEFDKHYGYPRRYRRLENSAMRDAEWTVVRFEPIVE